MVVCLQAGGQYSAMTLFNVFIGCSLMSLLRDLVASDRAVAEMIEAEVKLSLEQKRDARFRRTGYVSIVSLHEAIRSLQMFPVIARGI